MNEQVSAAHTSLVFVVPFLATGFGTEKNSSRIVVLACEMEESAAA